MVALGLTQGIGFTLTQSAKSILLSKVNWSPVLWGFNYSHSLEVGGGSILSATLSEENVM